MTRQKWNVLLPPTIDPIGPESLDTIATCKKRSEYDHPSELAADIDQYDAIITRTNEISANLIRNADQLEIIAKHGTGVDNIDIETATDQGVIVANTPGANTLSVSEHAVTLLLSVKRNVVKADNATRESEWCRQSFRGYELSDRTLGLFGAGNAGQRLATLLSGFNVSCVAYDPYVESDALPANVTLVDTIRELFSQADDVSVHTPLTDETYHAVSQPELELLPDNAVVVNTARGGIIDEEALVTALRNDQIGGAGIDVFEEEPPNPSDPLLHCENTVLTQHNAGVTVEALEKMSQEAAANVRAVYEGRVPETTLNPEAIK